MNDDRDEEEVAEPQKITVHEHGFATHDSFDEVNDDREEEEQAPQPKVTTPKATKPDEDKTESEDSFRNPISACLSLNANMSHEEAAKVIQARYRRYQAEQDRKDGLFAKGQLRFRSIIHRP